jgi:surface polysaccharide O-acyltransferase-like enzyme
MEILSKKRNHVLDIVKGFAIINIILIHTVWWSGVVYIPNEIIRQLTLLIDVPLFFFLSGWAASLHSQNLKVTLKRLWKLYIPYVIMIVVLLLFLAIFYHRIVPWEVIKQWLTFTSRDSFEFGVVMESMWFLAPFLIISIFSPIYEIILKSRKVSIFLICLLLCINIIFNFVDLEIANVLVFGMTSIRIVTFYLLFYFFGMYTKNIKLTLRQLLYILIPVLLLFFSYLWSVDFKFQLQANKFPPTMFYFIASMFSVLGTLYLKNFEERISKSIENNRLLRFLSFSGTNVFNIYLYQGFGGSVIYYLVYSPLIGQLHWIILLLLCFVCNLFVSYLLAYVFGELNRVVLSIKFHKNKNEL